jgi:hypothetical protein
MNTKLIRLLSIAAVFSISVLCLPASAAESEEGVVVYVHSEGATNAFLKNLGLPLGQSRAARLAVIRLVEKVSAEASFVLVWVPDGLSIHPDDRVEFLPTVDEAPDNPGNGVVSRVLPRLASAR